MSTHSEHKHGAAGTPKLIIFDVNETLSDMAPIGEVWGQAGVPKHLAKLWFAEVLRDGFALAATQQSETFANLAREVAHRHLKAAGATDVDASTNRILEGFLNLDVHPDVVEGIHALSALGIRLVTLSNGAASVADSLLTRAGLRAHFEAVLSVEAARRWKPAAQPYEYALDTCGTSAGQAMLVAVHPWDINGAAAAGMRTAYIARAEEPYPRYFAPPEITARTLTDLARQLDLH